MFLTPQELESAIYQYQIDQIVGYDETVVLTAIETAIEEVKSYLTPSEKNERKDGRLMYDVDAVFAAEGTERNALILSHTKTVAIWHIIQLCNADVIYEHVKERYDRAVSWLRDLASGKTNLKSLPQLSVEESPANRLPFRGGSRPKFNYE
jgi:phage gp36-like protein